MRIHTFLPAGLRDQQTVLRMDISLPCGLGGTEFVNTADHPDYAGRGFAGHTDGVSKTACDIVEGVMCLNLVFWT